MEESNWELPAEEHSVGVYIGLAIGAIVLGVGSAILFITIYDGFKKEGLQITSLFVLRALLFFGSVYATLASVVALRNIVSLQRFRTTKVGKEFKNFTLYARPLIEEVILQRILTQQIAQQLEQTKKAETYKEFSRKGATRWNETLVLIAIMASLSIGLFLYHDNHPFGLVPYSLVFLAIGWWVVIARHFEFLNDTRSFYIPAIYVLIVPSLSIILRAYIQIHEALFVVFFSLLPYVLGMYIYYGYITLGMLPTFIPSRFRGFEPPIKSEDVKKEEQSKENEVKDRLLEFMPPNNKGD
jgi:hypothetical protein